MKNLPVTLGVLALCGLACAAGNAASSRWLSPMPEAPAPCVDSAETVSGYNATCRPDQRGKVLRYPKGAGLFCRCSGGAP